VPEDEAMGQRHVFLHRPVHVAAFAFYIDRQSATDRSYEEVL